MCCEHRTLRAPVTTWRLTDQAWLEAAARRAKVRFQPAPAITWSLTWTAAPLPQEAPTLPKEAEVALA